MDLIYIERTTFESMMEQLDNLVEKVDKLAQEKEEKRLSGHFDGQDVCQLLRISPAHSKAFAATARSHTFGFSGRHGTNHLMSGVS